MSTTAPRTRTVCQHTGAIADAFGERPSKFFDAMYAANDTPAAAARLRSERDTANDINAALLARLAQLRDERDEALTRLQELEGRGARTEGSAMSCSRCSSSEGVVGVTS